jgi:hypothetical protein
LTFTLLFHPKTPSWYTQTPSQNAANKLLNNRPYTQIPSNTLPVIPQ